MKFLHSLAILAPAILLSSCGPESGLNPTQVVPPQPVVPVGPETSFVSDLRGSQLAFNDRQGENAYKLSRIGTYTSVCLTRKKQAIQGSGIFFYKQTGPKTGTLTFDLKKTYNLKFVSPHRATAKIPGERRSYTFEFEWM